MRVIAGMAKRRGLITPRGLAVRPTADRIKEALFNILGASVAGCRFLDMYAGAGTVGIEALSRGAGQVVFIEKEADNVRIIKKNLQITGLAENARCLHMPVNKAIALLASEQVSFELIFMDPPYGEDLIPDTLKGIAGNNLLKPKGIVVAESAKGARLPENVTGGLQMCRREIYSETMITFFQCK